MAVYCKSCGAKLTVRPHSPGVVYTICEKCKEDDLRYVDDIIGAMLDD